MEPTLEFEGKTYDELMFIFENLDVEIRALIRKRLVVEKLLLSMKGGKL